MKRALGSVAYLANVVLITPTGEEPWVQLGSSSQAAQRFAHEAVQLRPNVIPRPRRGKSRCGQVHIHLTVQHACLQRLSRLGLTEPHVGIIQHGLEFCQAPRQSGARLQHRIQRVLQRVRHKRRHQLDSVALARALRKVRAQRRDSQLAKALLLDQRWLLTTLFEPFPALERPQGQSVVVAREMLIVRVIFNHFHDQRTLCVQAKHI